MHIIKKQNPELPFYFILNGEEKNLQPFFDETNSQEIPHMILNGKRFVDLAGFIMPSIVFLENSVVVEKTDYLNLSASKIEKWYIN
jgi:hypothetical protein